MDELRPIWKSVFFSRRVLACIVKHIWKTEEAFREDYRAFSRAGDEEFMKEFFNPGEKTPRKSKTA